MIGKPSWFNRRKYTGWGIWPKTWQGWVYIAVVVAVISGIQQLPLPQNVELTALFAVIALLLIDVLHIMAGIPMDERETKIEAYAERNASWTMVAAIAMALLYISFTMPDEVEKVFPALVGVLVSGMIAKALTNLYLKNREV